VTAALPPGRAQLTVVVSDQVSGLSATARRAIVVR
jgi:hypothetical protein